MPDATPTAALPKRRWYQFSLRTLLVFMTVAACGFGWLGVKLQKAWRQKAAVQAIQKLGGSVEYDESASDMPTWALDILGIDFFGNIATVDLMANNLYIPATDDDLEILKEMRQLEALDLRSSDVGDAGMARIAEFTRLRELFLDGTHITDAGLSRVEGMTQLRTLHVERTSVSDVGLSYLKRLPLAFLSLNETAVSDAGLADLKEMNRLKWLDLQRTLVSDQGMADLRRALPECDIFP